MWITCKMVGAVAVGLHKKEDDGAEDEEEDDEHNGAGNIRAFVRQTVRGTGGV